MAYLYDPYNQRYIYYKDGTPPPKLDRSGSEAIPGFTDTYTNLFPNQPASQQLGGSDPGADNDFFSGGQLGPAVQVGNGSLDSPTATSSTTAPGTEAARQDAFEYTKRLFESYGLGSLAPKILEMVQQGYGADTIALMLQDTSEYKTRFAANDARMKAGLAILNPAEYMSLERSYRQILESNGMPAGFFDQQSDFTNWIGGDVSPVELQSRVEIAADAVANSDQSYLASLREYGFGQGDLIAAALDRERALPALQKVVKSARIGAEAKRNNLAMSQDRAGYFADLGVSQEQARGAYQAIGESLPAAERLGNLYGEAFGQSDLEDELLGGSGLASAKRKRLTGKETGTFSGASAVGQKSFAGKSRGEY